MRLNLNEKEKYYIEHIKAIISYSFQVLLFLFLLTLLVQQFYPEEIKSRLNINWFMFIVIVFGAVSIIFPQKNHNLKEKPVSVKDYVLILVLGILGGIIIYLKLNNLGLIGTIISILGGLIIILLSYLILNEKLEDGINLESHDKSIDHVNKPAEEHDYVNATTGRWSQKERIKVISLSELRQRQNSSKNIHSRNTGITIRHE